MSDLRAAAEDVRRSHVPNEWDSCVACQKQWPCAAELLAHAALAAPQPPAGRTTTIPTEHVEAFCRRVLADERADLAAIRSAAPVEPADHEHYWTDAPDDETGWFCTICRVTEYPAAPVEPT